MNIWKRVKNIWEFSKYEVTTDLQKRRVEVWPTAEAIKTVKQRKSATIIEPNEYTDDIPTAE